MLMKNFTISTFFNQLTAMPKRLAMVLTVLFTLGVGGMWGETYTITFKSASSDSSSDLGASPVVSNVVSSGTSYVASFSSCSKMYVGKSGIKLGASSSTGTMNFTLATNYQSNIKSIKVVSAKYGSDTGTLTLYSGSTSLKSGITPGTDYTHTFNTPTKVTSIKLTTSAKRAYITKIVITTEEIASYTVNWTINPAAGGTLSATTGNSITVTPNAAYTYGSSAYTVTSGTATVSQSGNTFTATPTANSTIQINMVEKPKYTVTLKDDNSILTQSTAGGSVTLPPRDGCDGYTFAGWTNTWIEDQTTWTTTAPTIIPAGSYTPTANESLYPVYKKTEGGGTSYQFQKVTALSQIKAGGTFIITNGSYYLPNAQASSSGPVKANMVAVTNGVVTGAVTDAMKWTFSAADANGKITIKSAANSNYYLYTTNSNGGLRVNNTSDT